MRLAPLALIMSRREQNRLRGHRRRERSSRARRRSVQREQVYCHAEDRRVSRQAYDPNMAVWVPRPIRHRSRRY